MVIIQKLKMLAPVGVLGERTHTPGDEQHNLGMFSSVELQAPHMLMPSIGRYRLVRF
jgi:hypothetical protein